MNNIAIIGNLTKAPEIYESKECTIATLSVAVNDFKKDEEITTYFTVKVFGKLAESCEDYLDKGNKVAVQGSMQTRNYEDKDGNKRVAWEIIANRVEFLTPAEKPTKRKR